MAYNIPYDENGIKWENRRKYLKAPTAKQIYDFIEELGVTSAAFERFYGIRKDTLRKIKCGDDGRVLPAKHWHIIYERIKPAYGIGFLTDRYVSNSNTNKSAPIKKKKQHISKKLLERLSEL